MKRLFIHHPLFRLLSPLFSGTMVYLLILLIHNNVAQIQDQFLGEELYVCIGLSLITQEFSRGLLLGFQEGAEEAPSLDYAYPSGNYVFSIVHYTCNFGIVPLL